MNPNYTPNNNRFPSFTYADASSEMDLDFNILSDYLFNEEEEKKFPEWNISQEDLTTKAADSSFNDLEGEDDDDDDDDDDDLSSDEANTKRKRTGKPRSQDQLERRRERNRILARKTRLRKKFFFESLQKQVAELAAENEKLKNVIRQRITGDLKNRVLSDCKPINVPLLTPLIATKPTSVLEKDDFNLIQAIQAAQRSFVITDPSLPDNPIIFASKGFLELSGYQLEDVLGRNCRFLQGPKTDPLQARALREGIERGEDTSVCLLNYRADGTEFYNQIFVAALRDADNRIINYVGVQVELKNMKPSAVNAEPIPASVPQKSRKRPLKGDN